MENLQAIKSNIGRVSGFLISWAFFILAWIGLSGCNLDTVKDIDGNIYKTVKIGNQVWMAENFKVTRFNDGTPIPLIRNYDKWAGLSSPAMSWYNNDSVNKDIYGSLYNWHVVNSKKLCPAGWHVPTDHDWLTLRMYLMVPEMAGGNLKETGQTNWRSPNTKATNSTGFTARGSGMRSYNGSFNYIKISGYWWSATPSGNNAYYNILNYKSSAITVERGDKGNGFSVRCIKDQ
jgi:uncharacterized protein (TIGR02145 family)